jgi:hypothetical protein
MIRITLSHPVEPLTSALYPASLEAQVIAGFEASGYTIIMVENLG